MASVPRPLEAVVFDKDGTLLDFHKTWNPGIEAAIRRAAHGPEEMALAAERLGFDLEACRTLEGSVLIADSNDAILARVDGLVDIDRFAAIVFRQASADVAANTGIPGLLDELAQRGIKLGLATNDYEKVARAQLGQLGWTDRFGAIVGCDSGFGAKPNPSMVIGACDLLGVDPVRTVMVGDNRHDLVAGRAAGSYCVLVTNRDDPPEAVRREADLVVPVLTHLISDLGLNIVD